MVRAKRNTRQPGVDIDGGPGKLPDWTKEQLIACGRGPLLGQWFTASEWDSRCRSQQRMRDLGSTRSGGALDYVLTREQVPHPEYSQVMGVRAVHQQEQPA